MEMAGQVSILAENAGTGMTDVISTTTGRKGAVSAAAELISDFPKQTASSVEHARNTVKYRNSKKGRLR